MYQSILCGFCSKEVLAMLFVVIFAITGFIYLLIIYLWMIIMIWLITHLISLGFAQYVVNLVQDRFCYGGVVLIVRDHLKLLCIETNL